MAGGEPLIDQVLAILPKSPPPLGTGRLELTPEQALIYVVYTAVLDKRRGFGDEAKVEGYVRQATGGGIASHEIEAAIARAEAAEL